MLSSCLDQIIPVARPARHSTRDHGLSSRRGFSVNQIWSGARQTAHRQHDIGSDTRLLRAASATVTAQPREVGKAECTDCRSNTCTCQTG